jgi:hypothetical protein
MNLENETAIALKWSTCVHVFKKFFSAMYGIPLKVELFRITLNRKAYHSIYNEALTNFTFILATVHF